MAKPYSADLRRRVHADENAMHRVARWRTMVK